MRSLVRNRVCTNIHWPRGRDQPRDLLVPKLIPGEMHLCGTDKVGVAA